MSADEVGRGDDVGEHERLRRALARARRGDAACPSAPSRASTRCEVERRAEPLERAARREQIPPRGRLVALGRQRLGVAEPRPGALVRQVGRAATAATTGRGSATPRRLVLAEQQLAAGRQRARLEERPFEVGGDRLELLDRQAAPRRGRPPRARCRPGPAAAGRASPGRTARRSRLRRRAPARSSACASSISPRASCRSARPGWASWPNS